MQLEAFALVNARVSKKLGETHAREAFEYLVGELRRAKKIVVLSGFYGEDFIVSALEQASDGTKGRELTLIVGSAPSVRADEQRQLLGSMARQIVETKYVSSSNLVVATADLNGFLHAKLFSMRAQGRPPSYVIGSANFSRSGLVHNDEISVAIRGAHAGLDKYIGCVVEQSISISRRRPLRPIETWRDFFRNGYLYFKPTAALAFSIDPFAEPEMKAISACLRKQSLNELPFAAKANVSTIDLQQLLQLDALDSMKSKFQLPTYAVQTDYGYWVPGYYVPQIERLIASAAGPKARRLEERGRQLQEAKHSAIAAQIDVYLHEVRQRLSAADPPLKLNKEMETRVRDKIRRRAQSVSALLSHPSTIERLSRSYIGAPVQEFWEDGHSVDEFFDGLCWDISQKIERSAAKESDNFPHGRAVFANGNRRSRIVP